MQALFSKKSLGEFPFCIRSLKRLLIIVAVYSL